jgi:hypothetical protein
MGSSTYRAIDNGQLKIRRERRELGNVESRMKNGEWKIENEEQKR